MPDLIEQFAERHFVLNQISAARRVRHVVTLREFETWLGGDMLTVTPNQVEAWMTEKVEAGYHVNTIRYWLMMLRPFWRWAWQAGHLDADTWLRVKEVPPPRGAVAQGEPKPYSRKEVDALWLAAAEKYPLATARALDRWARRTKFKRPPRWPSVAPHGRRLQLEAIISLALYCGLRRSEIFHLSLDDVHPDNAYVVVKGKRSDHREKPRPVPYNDAAREAVTRWLEFRRTLHIKTHRSLWLCLYGERWNEPIYATHFNGLLAGLGYEYHRLRHTCATERLRAGMPLEVLQRFLGHSNIQQTLAYAKIVAKDIHVQAAKSDDAFMKAVGRGRQAA